MLGLITATIAVAIITPERILNYIENEGTGRYDVFKVAIERFKESPVFGTGVGSSKYYLAKFNPTPQRLNNYHNFVLQVLSTMGIVGMGFFMYHIYSIVKKCINKSLYSLMMIIILAYMIINGLFDTVFFDWEYMTIYFALLALIGDKKDISKRYYLF